MKTKHKLLIEVERIDGELKVTNEFEGDLNVMSDTIRQIMCIEQDFKKVIFNAIFNGFNKEIKGHRVEKHVKGGYEQ